MLRLILSGCNGRMGKEVVSLCAKTKVCQIVAGIDYKLRPNEFFQVFSDPCLCSVHADVMLDFSHPNQLSQLITYCVNSHLPLVLAATGYTRDQHLQIEAAARQIPIFQAANLSIGANVLLHLAESAAHSLYHEYEIAIIERHHRSKRDSPSGTALLLVEAVSPLPADTFSLRNGTTAGEHTVLFAGDHETLELTHRADSRSVYARGALKTVQFMADIKEPGLYGMEHLLKKWTASE